MVDGTAPEPEIRHYRHGGTEVVDAGEEVDVYTAPLLKDVLFELGARSCPVAVDLRNTHLIDATGLAVIYRAHKRAKSRPGQFIILCDEGQERVLKPLREFHLTNQLDIRASLDQPAGAFSA